MPFRSVRTLLFFAALALGVTEASAQTRLLRFPDIYKDKVVFTYAGDLWLAPAAGGTATRLTAHPGIELFAKFSPDGQWIAFTGQYEGDEQVYVIPSTGGVPKQLTWYPARGPLSGVPCNVRLSKILALGSGARPCARRISTRRSATMASKQPARNQRWVCW